MSLAPRVVVAQYAIETSLYIVRWPIVASKKSFVHVQTYGLWLLHPHTEGALSWHLPKSLLAAQQLVLHHRIVVKHVIQLTRAQSTQTSSCRIHCLFMVLFRLDIYSVFIQFVLLQEIVGCKDHMQRQNRIRLCMCVVKTNLVLLTPTAIRGRDA